MAGSGEENNRGYHWHYLDGLIDAADETPAVREAMARYRLYTKAPVYVFPGEHIVGNLDMALDREPLVNRISANYLQRHVLRDIAESGEVSAKQKKELEVKLDAVKNEILYNKIERILSPEEAAVKECSTADSCHFNGHMVLDYKRLLEGGLDGIRGDIKKYKSVNTETAQQDFYRALEITLDGMAAFILRHAALALELIGKKTPGYDSEILKAVADRCARVSHAAPASFPEALQLLWFAMGFADYDSFGRFDQYMLPSYEKSKADGMTGNEAVEYMRHLWNKIEQNGAIINMTVGGVRPDGTDAVNDLTYLALEVTRTLKYKSPNLCLRIRHDSPGKLWDDVHSNLSVGQALPALYNDQVMIPMLINSGITPEDANDYALAGCSQAVIPGKSSFACDMGAYNTLKCLELALHDGYDPRTGIKCGPDTGKPDTLRDFDLLLDAYRAQAAYAIKTGVSINNKDHVVRRDDCSCVRSMLTRDCIEKGAGIFRGSARYYAVQNEVTGLTNTANALLAIKTAVYDNMMLSLEELVNILDADFAGYEDLRQYLLNKTPKFGNDCEEADLFRGMITGEFLDLLGSYDGELGGKHWAGEVIFHYHVAYGRKTLASADGRRAYEPLADSAGPSQGTDIKGPTAVLNSMLKIPMEKERTCCCLNLKFSKLLWKTGKDAVIYLFRSYFERGGYQLQVNVVDRLTLLDAKKNPEKHRSLVVRVGGYSAYFTALPADIQDDIIKRTENTI